jgi:murein DD-endopeptidase MepM/ murein hydrolase activator NlpD
MAQVSTPPPPTPKVKVRIKRKSLKKPAVVAPRVRRGNAARIFTLTGMAFVLGLAIATSIPANALLSPEDVAVMAEQSRLSTLPIGDGQSVEGTGENVAAGRDGVSVTSAQAAPTSGAYSVKKLAVNVPLSNNGVQWPVKEVKISSPFGDRNLFGYYNFHTGLDFSPDYGTPIYAVADGIVSLVEDPGPTCGVSIFIEHNVDGTKFTSVYCHMVPGSPPFKAGDTVKKGDLVGNIGLTGVTTGPHLHLEIRVGDSPIDPYAFLVQRAGKSPTESVG